MFLREYEFKNYVRKCNIELCVNPYDADSKTSNNPHIRDIEMPEEDEWDQEDVYATGLLLHRLHVPHLMNHIVKHFFLNRDT